MAEQLPVQFEFNSAQTFSGFLPGSNQETINHLIAAAEGIGEDLIFLWGEIGFGKTHLLQACCDMSHKLGIPSFYFDCGGFTALSAALFDGLETYPLLCLDNLQALCKQAELETALFTCFNRCRELQHRLILTADRHPKALEFLLPDLRTRINWGLTLKLHPLSDADKMAALTLKAKGIGLEITQQTAKYLLSHYDRSLTTLWAALAKLDRASLANQRKLTIPFLKQVLMLGD